MYNFDILLTSTSQKDNDSLDTVDVVFNIEDIPVASVESEFASVALCNKFFEDLTKSAEVIKNVKKHLLQKGCTQELVQLMNPQLLDHGIVLEVGRKDEALYSMEALSNNINLKSIKETLMKILDVIVNIIQKFTDQNRSDTNKLKELINGSLSDTSKVDTRKFAAIIASVYEYDDFMDLTNAIGKINLVDEISDGKSISDGISKTLKDIFTTAGYRVTDSSIERDPEFTMRKETMANLGWEPSKLRTAAEAALGMLEKVRRSHRTAIKELKGMIKSDLSESEADEAQKKLSYASKAIATIERISLVLSRQVIMLSGALKEKGNVSNESLEEDTNKKPCKKKKHVADCPCMDKDATSCECDCPLVDEDTDDVSEEAYQKLPDPTEFKIASNMAYKGVVRVRMDYGEKEVGWNYNRLKEALKVLDNFEKLRKQFVDGLDNEWVEVTWSSNKKALHKMPIQTLVAGKTYSGRDITEIWFAPEETLGYHSFMIAIDKKGKIVYNEFMG